MEDNLRDLGINLLKIEKDTLPLIWNDLVEFFGKIKDFSIEELSLLQSRIMELNDNEIVTAVVRATWGSNSHSEILGISCCSKGSDNNLKIELLELTTANGKLGQASEKTGIGQLLFLACKFLAFRFMVDGITIKVKNNSDLFEFLRKSGFAVVETEDYRMASGSKDILSSDLYLDIGGIVEAQHRQEILNRNRTVFGYTPTERRHFWEMNIECTAKEIEIKALRVQQAIQRKYELQNNIEDLSKYFSHLSSS